MNPIDDRTVTELQRALGRVSRQTSVVSANVANVDTPGYRALEVEFAEQVANAGLSLSRTAEGHLSPPASTVEGQIRESRFARPREDGNTVDIDVEMTRLAYLQGRYAAATQMIRKRFALLRYAATDGRQ